jgi:alpha-mannosidase
MAGGFPTFEGCHGDLAHVSSEMEVLLIDGHDQIEFRTRVDWDSYDVRLKVTFPVPWRPAAAWYGVPYGMLARSGYEPFYSWIGADGSWPALEWAGVQGPEACVALLERGTPGIRIGSDGLMQLSLLRSPSSPTYLHEPSSYAMTAYDGMRDSGRHHFAYALAAWRGDFASSGVVAAAEAFNAGFHTHPGRLALPPAPRILGDGVRLGALFRPADGNGLVLRVAECGGSQREAQIILPPGLASAQRCDLRLRPLADLPVVDGRLALPLRPWEIATLRLRR